ncbi:MAG TPA: DUF2294 domain-containing protein [Thermoguttaceae bacterium]|nr:DUF2294 domain-containing protein [Thermoguttaceae bacterium]
MAAAAVPEIEATKKANVAEHTEVFDHIGLLVNGPPGMAGLPFKSSSDVFASNRDRNLHAGLALARTAVTLTAGPRKVKWISALEPCSRAAWKLTAHMRTVSHVRPFDTVPGQVEATMKTQGETEAAICEGVRRFEQEYMGRGPKDIHTHLIGDLLVVRLQGVLTAAEQQLVGSLPAEKGRELLKQVRTQLIETARPVLESMVLEVTGVKVVSLHHDISTLTGEEIVLFTLATSPVFREKKSK